MSRSQCCEFEKVVKVVRKWIDKKNSIGFRGTPDILCSQHLACSRHSTHAR